jgi:hypothetical protein
MADGVRTLGSVRAAIPPGRLVLVSVRISATTGDGSMTGPTTGRADADSAASAEESAPASDAAAPTAGSTPDSGAPIAGSSPDAGVTSTADDSMGAPAPTSPALVIWLLVASAFVMILNETIRHAAGGVDAGGARAAFLCAAIIATVALPVTLLIGRRGPELGKA